MINTFKKFLRDETGAVTVDSVVVLGGSVWMATAILSDVGYATMSVTDKINDRLEYSSIIAEIVGDYGPGSGGAAGGSNGTVDCAGNPGNDKCVGNAGENPNGQGGWGSGSNGMSDGNNGNSGGNSSSNNSGSSSNSGSSNNSGSNGGGRGHGHSRGHGRP